ncbi:hypothetical protein [Mangrovibacterium diazotrophicum]|uniref:Uncharacterized protein n=1 Tax=Mangrovibacterium diazotrophicum TaxID=1261403 RepID=A0A419W3H1_9BACT|nr:hypothetical protein [Mangrovibacterium diazotrophicum]RKD90031.1 hypothetical protein BC643_0367 [Mangrovibacterium diazotrophicum]
MALRIILDNFSKVTVGSIWAAPNYIWNNGFARNLHGLGYHPAIVEKVKKDGISVQLTPGTSKTYKIGSCVFVVKLARFSRKSNFLLKLSMPYLIEDLEALSTGWDNVQCLSENQLHDFQTQIAFCKGHTR